MKKIAIVNNKGGCGKTTTVFNLAHYFAKQGLKTLTVDTDPQLNLSTNFGVNVNELNFSLGDYLLERSNEFEPEMLNENLHLISAGPEAEKDMEELKEKIAEGYFGKVIRAKGIIPSDSEESSENFKYWHFDSNLSSFNFDKIKMENLPNFDSGDKSGNVILIGSNLKRNKIEKYFLK